MHKDVDYRDKPYDEKSEKIEHHWWNLADSELLNCVGGLFHLESGGFRFYLPAYLDLALREPTNRSITAVWALVRRPDFHHDYSPALLARWEAEFDLLTNRQIDAVRNTLEWIIANNPRYAFTPGLEELFRDRMWHDLTLPPAR